MKKIISLLTVLVLTFSQNIYAHDGHVHTGTFLENVSHFILTNSYIVVPIAVAAYFLIRNLRSTVKEKKK